METLSDAREELPSYREEKPVDIPSAQGSFSGSLGMVLDPIGVVLIANETGAGRHKRCELELARALREAGAATLMVDVITSDEQADRDSAVRLRLDAMRLAHRVADARSWLARIPALRSLPVALVGEGGAGAAALIEATSRPNDYVAVVARAAQPQLAGAALDCCARPVLLVVDARDAALVQRNRAALARLGGQAEMVAIDGACTESESACAPHQISRLIARWVAPHLRGSEAQTAHAPCLARPSAEVDH